MNDFGDAVATAPKTEPKTDPSVPLIRRRTVRRYYAGEGEAAIVLVEQEEDRFTIHACDRYKSVGPQGLAQVVLAAWKALYDLHAIKNLNDIGELYELAGDPLPW